MSIMREHIVTSFFLFSDKWILIFEVFKQAALPIIIKK